MQTRATRKGKRLFLIHTPIDATRYADAKQHYAPSQGLIDLRTFVLKSCPHVDVEVIDGALIDTQSIIEHLHEERPDIVGQSVQQLSYAQALAIASEAKAIGAVNIFGGQHATQLAGEIIRNRYATVDGVVRHDGQIPLAMLLHEVPKHQIPNLTFWDGTVRHNFAVQWELDLYPLPDYDEIDLTPYVQHYSQRLNLSTPNTFLRMHSHKGCGNRSNSRACYFCGRADQGVRFKTPDRYVEELFELRHRWRVDSAFDTGDDIAFDKTWLEEVARKVERRGVDLELGCFGRTSRLLDPDIPRLLRRIGVTNIIIGFESGDREVLLQCGKGGVMPEDNLRAAANLFSNGIDVCASYVIGLPGESEASLRRTFMNAQQLLELSRQKLGRDPYELVANFFEPSPGSPSFRRVRQMFPEKYEGQDLLDLEEVQRDYFRAHWNLPTDDAVAEFRQMLVEWGARLNSMTMEADSQGFRADEIRSSFPSPSNLDTGCVTV